MPALSKYWVLLTLFLLESHANVLTSVSLVAGDQVWVIHLIQLQQPMSDPTNEPSCEPSCKPTKWFGQDALLPGNLSSKGVMFSNQGQDNEIQSNSTNSSNTQPSNWQGPKQQSFIISACVPFVAFHSNQRLWLNCWIHSHTGFESVTSAKKVSFSAFTLLVHEPVTFVTKASCNTFASLVWAPVALTNKINLDSTSFKKINRSSTHACLVLFSSFGGIGAELKCGLHPNHILVTSSSKSGLRHHKKSEQAGGKASTQPNYHKSNETHSSSLLLSQSEGAHIAPTTTFRAFELIVALFSIADFLHSEGAELALATLQTFERWKSNCTTKCHLQVDCYLLQFQIIPSFLQRL